MLLIASKKTDAFTSLKIFWPSKAEWGIHMLAAYFGTLVRKVRTHHEDIQDVHQYAVFFIFWSLCPTFIFAIGTSMTALDLISAAIMGNIGEVVNNKTSSLRQAPLPQAEDDGFMLGEGDNDVLTGWQTRLRTPRVSRLVYVWTSSCPLHLEIPCELSGWHFLRHEWNKTCTGTLYSFLV